LKNKKQELKEILELQYGLLDQLMSQGTCDLEQVKIIEYEESAIKHRKKLVEDLVKKLTSSTSQCHREQILKLLKKSNQRHVAEFIEHEGRKYCSVYKFF
jgi:hypothetical protein